MCVFVKPGNQRNLQAHVLLAVAPLPTRPGSSRTAPGRANHNALYTIGHVWYDDRTVNDVLIAIRSELEVMDLSLLLLTFIMYIYIYI